MYLYLELSYPPDRAISFSLSNEYLFLKLIKPFISSFPTLNLNLTTYKSILNISIAHLS